MPGEGMGFHVVYLLTPTKMFPKLNKARTIESPTETFRDRIGCFGYVRGRLFEWTEEVFTG